jgi:hypothetical protein
MPAASRPWLHRALAVAILYLVLIQPNHPAAMTWGALVMFPLELPVILLGLVALPPGARATVAAARGSGCPADADRRGETGRLCDLHRLQPRLQPAGGRHLIHAAWMLGSGSIGVVPAALTVALAAAGLGLGGWLVWWSTGQWAALAPGVWLRGGAAAMLVPAGALMVGEIGHALRAWQMPVSAPGAAFTARVGYERVVFYRAALADLEEFRREAAQDPFAGADPDRLFDRIGAHDVLLVFVESYGRSSFLNPLYIDTHTGTLPNRGPAGRARPGDALGLSDRADGWRAKLAGAWRCCLGAVDRQPGPLSGAAGQRPAHAVSLCAGGRLSHRGNHAGHVFAWPEADFFGFDAIYMSPPIWVTRASGSTGSPCPTSSP